jgi:RNA polymerase sigma-70 factor (ECF subfamily)
VIGTATARSDATDEMLMVRYQRGDREAFAELVRRYQGPVHNFVFRQLRPANIAEDLTQEVFLRVVHNAADFKHEASFSTWLYTITRSLCVDELRKHGDQRHHAADPPSPAMTDPAPLIDGGPNSDPSSSVDRTAATSEVQACIVRAVDQLPDEQREVFLLRQVANLPFGAIAEVTGVGETAVKSRMRYALDRLQGALSGFEEYSRALR